MDISPQIHPKSTFQELTAPIILPDIYRWRYLFMPTIRPSSDLRNNYNEISELCHKYGEPVYITKNGQGDLAVMSIETYERLVGKFELYKLLEEGTDAMKQKKVRSFRLALNDIQKGLKNE
jgi:prevent-host-death family protein